MKNNRYSDAKIVWFPEKLASFRDGNITAPIYVRVKPTNRCNQKCDFCAYGHGDWDIGMHETVEHRDVIPRQKMLEVLEDFHALGVKAVTYSGGGEPLMHPDITEFMSTTVQYGIDLSIITNGSMLEGERAAILRSSNWTRVSMDYTDATQMSQSRRVPENQFGRVLKNISEFAKAKPRSCELGVNYIVTQTNVTGLAAFCKRLRDCGVENVRISPVWRPDFAAYHKPIASAVASEIDAARALTNPAFAIYSSYDLDSSSHQIRRGYHKCYFSQMVPVVGADQFIYGCHNVAFSEHGKIGSIKNRRFRDLWFSDEARRFFDGLDPDVSCRHQCASDGRNKLIAGFLELTNDNFV
ncbi:MAG: radical SAM protein [Patescibacteria group bacterium]|nr:radical SAM protein [Patescibacteria group bacterium]